MNDKTNEFLVKDLYLAAILVTKGLEFTDVRPYGKAFLFVFNADEAKPIEQEFWKGTLDGNYKQLVNTIHDLKAQMRSMSTATGEYSN
jgi:hypothetical protein